ncbi:DinB family protein [Streptomyces cavernae]|uniref:DinB family protein n=1 Tax=Streptomyces cavernae TaxID=2259034 RepID=UPI000FEBA2E7|nr:DinB family protein [Streptomyces cavernae]
MTRERGIPSPTGDERPLLEGWLDFHRQTLAAKCAGLDDPRLRTAAVEPSELSLLGLVRHMAEMERVWFRKILAGETLPPLYYSDADRDGEFHPTPDDTWAEAYTTWQREIEAARRTTGRYGLDDLTTGKDSQGRVYRLRWIYVHMIQEYARHNGHADLVRERIDGATGT